MVIRRALLLRGVHDLRDFFSRFEREHRPADLQAVLREIDDARAEEAARPLGAVGVGGRELRMRVVVGVHGRKGRWRPS
jgi:hypothetical protein